MFPTQTIPYPRIAREIRRVPIGERSYECLDKVISMSDEFRSRSKEIEDAKRLPQDIIDRMADANCWTLAAPEELDLGGGEVDYPFYWRILEELGRSSPTAGWCVLTHLAAATLSNKLTLEGARKLWTTKSTSIAGQPGGPGKAVRVEGGFRLISGEWMWASNSGHATHFMGGFQVVEKPDDNLIPFPPRPGQPMTKVPEMRVAYYPRKDVEVVAGSWESIGLRGTHSGKYRVTDKFVPQDLTYTLMDDYHCTSKGPAGIGGHAAVILGAARWALEYFYELAATKDPVAVGMTSGALGVRPVVQYKIAEAEAKLRAARAWFYDVINDCWARWLKDPDSIANTDHLESQMVNVYLARVSKEVVEEVYELCGSTGVFQGDPLEQIFRDVATAQSHMSVQAKNYESYGKALTGNLAMIFGVL